LSALCTSHLYTPQGNIPGIHFCYKLCQPQGHSAARRIMSTKNSNGTIRNQTRDLPPCRAVPQPTAPLRTPRLCSLLNKFRSKLCLENIQNIRPHLLLDKFKNIPYLNTNSEHIRIQPWPQKFKSIRCLNLYIINNAMTIIDPLKMKRRPLYLKTQSQRCSKHFLSRL